MRLEAARAAGALSQGAAAAAEARALQGAGLLQRACSGMGHEAALGCADAWSRANLAQQPQAQHTAGSEVPLCLESVALLTQRLLFNEHEEQVQVQLECCHQDDVCYLLCCGLPERL